MSKGRSGLPGICTAVRHFVWVSLGAPGPLQAANARLENVTQSAAKTAEITRSLPSFEVVLGRKERGDMDSSFTHASFTRSTPIHL